jgi:4-hydroxy-tetrahydrodipicolinate synthase
MRDLHYGFTCIYETLMSLGTWPAALKSAHVLLGQPAGVPREPVAPLGSADTEKLCGVMRDFGLIGEGGTILAAK